MTKKFHVAFDMDDTLCSLVAPSIEMARKVLGKKLQIPSYGNYRGWFPGQLNEEERTELLRHVYTEEFYMALPSNFAPMHNVTIEKVSRCAWEHYESVTIITARGKHVLGDRAVDVTRAWLKKHNFIDADSVPIYAHEHDVMKSSFLRSPTVMVDDSTHVADDFAKDDNHRVIMIDQVWNQGHPRHRYMTRSSTRKLCDALVSASERQPDWV